MLVLFPAVWNLTDSATRVFGRQDICGDRLTAKSQGWTFRVITGQQTSARTALGTSRPQRLICSRRRSFIPSTVTAWNHPSPWPPEISLYCVIYTLRRKIRQFFVEVCRFSGNYVVFRDTSTKNPAIHCGSVLVFRKLQCFRWHFDVKSGNSLWKCTGFQKITMLSMTLWRKIL